MLGVMSRTMARVLRRARHRAFGLSARTSVADRIRFSRWRRERLLILGYHGISLDDEHEWNPRLYMTAEVLRARLTALMEAGHVVLPLDEAVRRLHERTLPPASVVLTFDDGNYDFKALALPLLRELGLPATLYVTTFYSQMRRPVYDVVVRYVAWKGRGAGRRPGTGLVDDGGDLLLATPAERAATIERIDAACHVRDMSAAARDLVARRFAERIGVDYDEILERRILGLMTAQEIAEVERAGVDVQLHTHRHRCPPEPALFAREIAQNRAALDATGTGAARAHFCYPSGLSDPVLLPTLRAAGIVSATTCEPRLATPDDDPLLLPRYVDCQMQHPDAFDAWASGLADLLSPHGLRPSRRPARYPVTAADRGLPVPAPAANSD